MSQITISGLSFYYDFPYKEVFTDIHFTLDTDWKLGIIGRNGCGKSTLFHLLTGRLLPDKGNITCNVRFSFFPYLVQNSNQSTFQIIKNHIAPFDHWKQSMDYLLENPTEENLMQYGEIEHLYQNMGGYEVELMIEKEAHLLDLTSLLYKNFNTLSGGEQTRSLLLALFLKKDQYVLLDEPTNHLDKKGMELVADYLSCKKGYSLISHDRYFLDKTTDHILSINKSSLELSKGNYSTWFENFANQQELEKKTNENLKKEIRNLKESAKVRRGWSALQEKNKINPPRDRAVDKGYVGHKSAKMMKTALNIEKRSLLKIEQKEELLKNSYKEYQIRFPTVEKIPETVLAINDLGISFAGRSILKGFNLNVGKGERVALVGKNGCGKSSLLNAAMGNLNYQRGSVFVPGFIKISKLDQNPDYSDMMLGEYMRSLKVDLPRFRQILGALYIKEDVLIKNMKDFSAGEIKKIGIALSLLEPFHLYLWDEPLNYLDIETREMIESAILRDKPTMVFVEHDLYFIKKVATRVVELC